MIKNPITIYNFIRANGPKRSVLCSCPKSIFTKALNRARFLLLAFECCDPQPENRTLRSVLKGGSRWQTRAGSSCTKFPEMQSSYRRLETSLLLWRWDVETPPRTAVKFTPPVDHSFSANLGACHPREPDDKILAAVYSGGGEKYFYWGHKY